MKNPIVGAVRHLRLPFTGTASRVLVLALTAWFTAASPTPSHAQINGNWVLDADGNWSLATNWSSDPSIPGGVGSQVGLTADITGTRIITIDSTSRTVGVLTIGDANSSSAYTLAASGGAGLIMDNTGATNAQIINLNTAGGNTLISAPITLNDSLELLNDDGGELQLTGIVSGTANIFNMGAGGGPVILSNAANSFAGSISNSSATSRIQFNNGDGALGHFDNDIFLTNNAEIRFSSHTLLNGSRSLNVGIGGARITSTPGGNILVHIAGNITGTGNLTTSGAPITLSGKNTISGTLAASSTTVRFSSLDNIGGATATLGLAGFGTSGYAIMGTEIANFGSVTINQGIHENLTLDIQNPDHEFTWDRVRSTTGNTAGATIFTKTGAGTLVVTAAQSYLNSGSNVGMATAVNGGVFKIDAAAGGSLANTASSGQAPNTNRMAFAGGTLHLAGQTAAPTHQYLGHIRLNAGGGNIIVDNVEGTSSTTLSVGNLGDFLGFVNPTSTVIAPANGSSLNIITQPGGNGGSATLNSTSVNDATGIVNSRVLFNGTDWATSAAASGSYAFDDATNTLTGSLANGTIVTFMSSQPAGITLYSLYVVINSTGTTFQIAGSTAGSAINFTSSGNANLNASGAISAYSGYTTVAAAATPSGTDANNSLITSTSGAAGAVTAGGAWTTNSLKISGGSTLDMGGNLLSLTSGGLLFTGSTNFQITNGNLASAMATTNSDLIIHHYGTGNLTIGAVIQNGAGASTLTKTGTGTLILSNANTYTGATFVNGGTLSISNVNQLSNAGINLNGGTLRATENLTLSGSRTLVLGGSGGTIDVADDRTLIASNSILLTSGSLTLDNSDAGGNGVLQLNGGNLFTGGVFINSGTLRINSAGAIGQAGANTLAFGAGAKNKRLQLNGFNAAVAALTSENSTAIVENTHATTATTFTVANGADNTFGGTIQDGGAAALSFTKMGAGDLVLTGVNTYTGVTTISGGALIVHGSLNSSGSVVVGRDASLGGYGSVGAISGEGAVNPGASPGIFTATSLDPSDGIDLNFEMTQATPNWVDATGSGNDVLRLTLDSAITAPMDGDNVLSFYLTGIGSYLGGIYTDEDSDFTSLISGAEINLYVLDAEGTVSYEGNLYSEAIGTWDVVQVASADFAGGTVENGWAMQVTVVPEPASGLLALLTGGTLLLLRRRRGNR